jgi:hypothetical protein
MDEGVVSAAKPYLASVVRHGATYAAGYLVAHDVITQGDVPDFVRIAVPIGLAMIGLGWSFIQKLGQAHETATIADAHYTWGKQVGMQAANLAALQSAGVRSVQQGG